MVVRLHGSCRDRHLKCCMSHEPIEERRNATGDDGTFDGDVILFQGTSLSCIS